MSTLTCPAWCTGHRQDFDGSEIHHGSVTRGDVEVILEDSPSWPREGSMPVQVDVQEADADGARELAAALLEAARLLDGGATVVTPELLRALAPAGLVSVLASVVAEAHLRGLDVGRVVTATLARLDER